MIDTAELKELLNAATPRPWTSSIGHFDNHVIIDRNGWTLLSMDTLAPNGPRFNAARDAALIVAAVNALPDLLARVEELERWNAHLSDRIEWAIETLHEINVSNYDHDDVCRLNAASVEVILGLDAPMPRQGGDA